MKNKYTRNITGVETLIVIKPDMFEYLLLFILAAIICCDLDCRY